MGLRSRLIQCVLTIEMVFKILSLEVGYEIIEVSGMFSLRS